MKLRVGMALAFSTHKYVVPDVIGYYSPVGIILKCKKKILK